MTVFKFVVKSVVTVKYLFEPVQAPVMLHAIVTFAPDIPQILAWASGGALSKRLSVLLASASFGGTIAAVRHLAKHNIDVRVVSSQSPWSGGMVTSCGTCPIPRRRKAKANVSLSGLLAIGAADPGQILLPTSDETAWMYTENAAELGRYFCIASTVDCDPAENPGQEAFCGCCDQRRAYCVAELGSAKHRRCRGVGADLALSDPYKTAHACPPPQATTKG